MADATPADSGGTPRVTAQPDDGSLRIRGGVGGISFQFEELLAGAAALEGLVRQLRSVEVEADAIRRGLFPYQSDSYASGSDAIIAVGEAGRGVGRVRSQLQGIGDGVLASHRDYEYAEARNSLLLRLGLHGPGYGAAAEPFAFPGVRGIVEGWVATMPGGLAALLGLPAPLASVAGALRGSTDVRRLVRAGLGRTGIRVSQAAARHCHGPGDVHGQCRPLTGRAAAPGRSDGGAGWPGRGHQDRRRGPAFVGRDHPRNPDGWPAGRHQPF